MNALDIYHGVVVPDPYRWLEDPDSRETRAFVKSQHERTRAYLDGLPGRDIIRRRVSAMLQTEDIRNPLRVRNRYFFLKVIPHKEQPVIAVRELGSSVDDVLVDPASRNEGSTVSVEIVRVSLDGRLLAYGIRHGGEDAQALEFLDIEKRLVLPDRLSRGRLRGFEFTPDSEGFLYVRENVDPQNPGPRGAYRHSLGDDFTNDECLFKLGDDPRMRFTMSVSCDGRLVLYNVSRVKQSMKIQSYFLQNLETRAVTRLADPEPGSRLKVGLVGNRLIGTLQQKGGKTVFVEIDPESPAPNGWRPILADETGNARFIVPRGELFLVPVIRDFASVIEVVDANGNHKAAIPHPAGGTAELLQPFRDDNDLFVRFESFFQPPSIYRYVENAASLERFSKVDTPFEASLFEQSETSYRSKDGTEVHMFLLARKDMPEDTPAPTILTAYGGFGANMTPRFSVFVNLMLECGCRFALPNIRGGSELGRRWYEAGRRRNRRNAIDDFLAAAEWLVQHNLTTPKQLAIFGGSNSGLLVGAAMTQRPDLFRAVLCIAPLLDMLRYDQFDRAYKWVSEYGIANDEEDFPVLYSYSPYHHVRKRSEYPATLFVSGDSDTRCNPMHVRKMVARLLAANAGDTPILMDCTPLRGHSPTLPLSVRIAALTDRLAFVCDQLGVTFKGG